MLARLHATLSALHEQHTSLTQVRAVQLHKGQQLQK
jgi:hypothetical protein